MSSPTKAKKITELPENTTVSNEDIFVTGMGGTSELGKTKWSKILAKLRSVLFANNLTTNTEGYGMDARQGPVIAQKISNVETAINQLNTNMITKNTFTGEWMPGFMVEGYGFMVQVPRLSKKHKMTITDVQIYHNAAWHSVSPAVTERLNCWLIACTVPADLSLQNGYVYLAKITGTISQL